MIRVLVVEDEPLVAEAHRTFVDRTEGFEVVGVAGSGREALAALKAGPVDVVLLDFYLPDMTGLDICRAIRRAGAKIDVIAVTAARDLDAVRSAVSLGVVQYIVKPFTSQLLREKLERYAEYHRKLKGASGPLAQQEVDAMLSTLRGSTTGTLPKGLSEATLQQVVAVLRRAEGGLSAAELGTETGVARVTARRYLEHLADVGLAERTLTYGGPGRPEQRYRWTRRTG